MHIMVALLTRHLRPAKRGPVKRPFIPLSCGTSQQGLSCMWFTTFENPNTAKRIMVTLDRAVACDELV